MKLVELGTVAAADHVLSAPQEHIDMEPPAALLEIIDQIDHDLRSIRPRPVGLALKLVKLALLRGKIEERLVNVCHGEHTKLPLRGPKA